jgi:hypothetical protein
MKHTQQSIQRIRHGAHGVRLYLGIVVAISTAACAPSPNPSHQTVDYYRANTDARKAKLVECENDPGALGQTPDCINAHRAARLEERPKSFRDLPPMGLLEDAKKSGSPDHADSPNSSVRDKEKPRESR